MSPAPAAAAASTVVTIGFDDGSADQLGVLPLLQAHGMTATFLANTGTIGDAEHLSWADLRTLYGVGNEIAGRILDHVDLKPLITAEARQQVCSGTEAVVHDRGYNSGRGVSGISKKGPHTETIPPLDPYATRTPPNPKKATKVSTPERYVQNAEANGGGWVQLVFHHLCEQCDAYAITPSKLTAFLDFLQGEVAAGRVTVQTTAQVIGGAGSPPVSP